MAPLVRNDRRAPLLGDHPRKPLVPRFIVVLFAVGLVWTWALLIGWWLMRGEGG